ncbi:hypothetical protein TNIN_286231 [Trichonephila inaurata madagascariensis]|uniref:Uncharacterized protein n=1 Tax=Trichonephila inaurata madagascariensis TaxID=2747483 RepID=A0A8X6XI06_9ARAC|nr:hypothetical protein TNIN_286231 [Trichonephila inaurata madagascariensis]
MLRIENTCISLTPDIPGGNSVTHGIKNFNIHHMEYHFLLSTMNGNTLRASCIANPLSMVFMIAGKTISFVIN